MRQLEAEGRAARNAAAAPVPAAPPAPPPAENIADEAYTWPQPNSGQPLVFGVDTGEGV